MVSSLSKFIVQLMLGNAKVWSAGYTILHENSGNSSYTFCTFIIYAPPSHVIGSLSIQ